jgi:predicted tellurium resistance membrane protein TerC
MEYLFTIDSLISFFVLVVLEIILGIDNVIFVSIIINRLPEKDHKRARFAWMVMGIIVRSILLFGVYHYG